MGFGVLARGTTIPLRLRALGRRRGSVHVSQGPRPELGGGGRQRRAGPFRTREMGCTWRWRGKDGKLASAAGRAEDVEGGLRQATRSSQTVGTTRFGAETNNVDVPKPVCYPSGRRRQRSVGTARRCLVVKASPVRHIRRRTTRVPGRGFGGYRGGHSSGYGLRARKHCRSSAG